ncbi:MAG: hypothetical protein HY556_07660 [Euryarchaeota archaeon]|nr:hypothetical protein [Euryarchaeota archaeon]
MKPVILVFILLVASAVLSPPAVSQGVVVPALRELKAGYGSEAWKDEAAQPTIGGIPTTPVTGSVPPMVYSNPYYDGARPHHAASGVNYVGYNLTAVIDLQDDRGAPPSGPDNYVINASIATTTGVIPAKLTKLSAYQFRAQFDLDGESGKPFPVLLPGSYSMKVEVLLLSTTPDPTIPPTSVSVRPFSVTASGVAIDIPGTFFPEERIKGYTDIGAGNLTLLQTTAVAPSEPVEVTAVFREAAGRLAEIVVQNKDVGRVIKREAADSNGRVIARFQPSEVTGNANSALLVIEAHLVGDENSLGSSAVAVPVAARPVTTLAYRHEARQIAGQGLSQAEAIIVQVNDTAPDVQSGSTGGDAFALDASGRIVTSAAFQADSFVSGNARLARLPAEPIRAAGLTTYRVISILYKGDDFYALTTAQRGFTLSVPVIEPRPRQEAQLNVTLSNYNNNFDVSDDVGLAMTVSLKLVGPGSKVFEDVISLRESQQRTIVVPFRSDVAGNVRVSINATSGELEIGRDMLVRVADPPQSNGLFDLPTPAYVLGAAAVIAAGLSRRRS